jgi:hypothetical protein
MQRLNTSRFDSNAEKAAKNCANVAFTLTASLVSSFAEQEAPGAEHEVKKPDNRQGLAISVRVHAPDSGREGTKAHSSAAPIPFPGCVAQS